MKEKLIEEFVDAMNEVYAHRDMYGRGKIIDLAKEAFEKVINENLNISTLEKQYKLLDEFRNFTNENIHPYNHSIGINMIERFLFNKKY